MVDIQQRTLRTFKHDEIATLTRPVEQVRNVNHHRSQDVGNSHRIIQNFLVINRFSFVVVNQLEVVIFHHFFQFFSEGFFVEKVANTQTATCYFIFISRPDTTTGGADRFRATRFHARYPAQRDNQGSADMLQTAADAHERGCHGLPVLSSLSSARPETAQHRYR